MSNGLIGIMLLLCSYKSQLITAEASSVYVTIRGANVSENGYIDFDSIGSTNAKAVLCHTNDPTCCAKGQDNPGDWYFPDGSVVESYTNNVEQGGFIRSFFARNRGINPSVVRLYHAKRSSHMIAQERGRFRCEIHDAAGNLQQLHVNILDIGDVSVSIRNATAGERCELTLECSANISPYPLPANVTYPHFEWFFGPTISSLPVGVTLSDVRNTRNNYISTLQFSPLLSHHFGMYTCRLGGNERLAAHAFIPGKNSTLFTEDNEATDPKKDQNQILLFGSIIFGLAAFILVSAVVVLVILLVRKKHHVQSYIVDNDVYDRINRYPLSTTGSSVHKRTKLNVPVYENIQLGNANECDSEKIKFSRCPAYEDTLTKETSH